MPATLRRSDTLYTGPLDPGRDPGAPGEVAEWLKALAC